MSDKRRFLTESQKADVENWPWPESEDGLRGALDEHFVKAHGISRNQALWDSNTSGNVYQGHAFVLLQKLAEVGFGATLNKEAALRLLA